MAGTEGAHDVALWLLERLRSFGIAAELSPTESTLSTPHHVRFNMAGGQLVGPTAEPAIGATPVLTAEAALGFNAYSGSGTADGKVVYVNYGTRQDYEWLKAHGRNVTGRILLARYGAISRGVKAKLAEANGAVALLLYSDPKDDGSVAGVPYPAGPWRPTTGVERGTVMYEELTPGGISQDRSNVPRIPVLPMSAADARYILRDLRGPDVPPSWRGGLKMSYRLGPSARDLRVGVAMTERKATLWNVIARIPGDGSDEGTVLVGNHHDAWVYGGIDPGSGTAAVLEFTRILGDLLKTGWRPRRPIWIAFWDGEEFGELGSSQWAESSRTTLQGKLDIYINLDTAVAGHELAASAPPSLHKMFTQAARDALAFAGPPRWSGTAPAGRPALQRDFAMTVPGGGSDFIAFFDHLGIPSIDFEFDGLNGNYHSRYDNHDLMVRILDPGFSYHVAATRLVGLIATRLADSDVLPLDYAAYAQAILTQLRSLPPPPHTRPSYRDSYQASINAALRFRRVAQQLNAGISSALARAPPPPAESRQIDRLLVKCEQEFLLEDGLPHRPWYRHSVYAPDLDSDYDPVTLPLVREALRDAAPVQVDSALSALSGALARSADDLEEALAVVAEFQQRVPASP